MPRPLTDRERNRIKRWIANAERDIKHKCAVRDRHAPGTAYHTRAQREIDGIQAKINNWRKQLCGR